MTTPTALNTALAEELLLCTYDDCAFASADEDGPKDPDAHWKECPSFYRPAVALALQSKDDSAALEFDRLKGEIARLRAALEPFAVVGKIIDSPFGPRAAPDDGTFQSGCAWQKAGETRTLTWGDFRKARAALQTDGGKLE